LFAGWLLRVVLRFLRLRITLLLLRLVCCWLRLFITFDCWVDIYIVVGFTFVIVVVVGYVCTHIRYLYFVVYFVGWLVGYVYLLTVTFGTHIFVRYVYVYLVVGLRVTFGCTLFTFCLRCCLLRLVTVYIYRLFPTFTLRLRVCGWHLRLHTFGCLGWLLHWFTLRLVVVWD